MAGVVSRALSGALVGEPSGSATGRPLPRGALVVAPAGGQGGREAALVVARLTALKWEVLRADADLAVTPASAE
eukprot:2125857-Prymnesium_polylepis.1